MNAVKYISGRMRIVFDVDLERDDLGRKLQELKEIENTILVEIRGVKIEKIRDDAEVWLRAQPEKSF